MEVRFGQTRFSESIHTYFIPEKRKLSITNENKKATFEVFVINPVFFGVSGSLGLFMSCNPKENLIQNIFTIFRKKIKKNRKDFAKPGCHGQFWPTCVYSFCFVFFSLASQ